MTPKKIETIIRRYNDLTDLATQFVRRNREYDYAYGPARFDENGNIRVEINTACNCHPEYSWVVVGTKEEFSEWVINKQ